jgi:ribosomal-protein-alanine N-acetyltransferase
VPLNSKPLAVQEYDGIMIAIEPMRKEDAEEIVSWRYPVPYAMYNLSKNDIPVLLNSENRYFSVYDGPGKLMGYCCFGEEARVSGGEYAEKESEVLDVGVGMNPEKVGKGHGKFFIDAILAFALEEFGPSKFRVSIAEFNERSQRAFQNQGFEAIVSFIRSGDGMKFVQLEREAML